MSERIESDACRWAAGRRRGAWKIHKQCQGSGSHAKHLAGKKSLPKHGNEDRLKSGREVVVNKD